MSNTNNNKADVNILDLVFYLLSKWPWFLLSILICGGVAWYKYATAPLVYFGQATVIIKDPSNKTASAGLDRYDNLINKVNVANEILQFRSKKLMSEVVSRLEANVSYSYRNGLRSIELYTQSPIKASFPEATATTRNTFTVSLAEGKKILFSKVAGVPEEYTLEATMGDTVQLPSGEEIVLPGDVEFAHKVCIRDLKAGEPVIKYGEEIGYMLVDVKQGTWIHNHNMGCDRGKK